MSTFLNITSNDSSVYRFKYAVRTIADVESNRRVLLLTTSD